MSCPRQPWPLATLPAADSSYWDAENDRWIVKGPVVHAGIPVFGGRLNWPACAVPNPEPEPEE